MCHGEASPATEGAPQRRLPGARGAGAQPAPTPQSRLRGAAERNAPPRRPPPPARRAAARQSLALEAARSRSSRHPDAGLDPAAPRKITEGRKSRARGHSSRKAPNCGPVPGKRAPNRTERGDGGRGDANSPRKVSTRPSERGSSARERPEPQSGPPASGTCLFPRLQQRGPGGAARRIGHERGFLQLSRPRCLPRAAPPGPAPSGRGAGLGTELAGSAGGRRARGPRSRDTSPCSCLAPGSSTPLRATRAPPDTGRGREPGARVPRGPHPLPTRIDGPCQRSEDEDREGAASRAHSPQQGRPDRVSSAP